MTTTIHDVKFPTPEKTAELEKLVFESYPTDPILKISHNGQLSNLPAANTYIFGEAALLRFYQMLNSGNRPNRFMKTPRTDMVVLNSTLDHQYDFNDNVRIYLSNCASIQEFLEMRIHPLERVAYGPDNSAYISTSCLLALLDEVQYYPSFLSSREDANPYFWAHPGILFQNSIEEVRKWATEMGGLYGLRLTWVAEWSTAESKMPKWLTQ